MRRRSFCRMNVHSIFWCFALAIACGNGDGSGGGSDGNDNGGDGGGPVDMAGQGCPPGGMQAALASGQTLATCGARLVLDGDGVYWLAGAGMGGGVVRKVAKSGGAVTDLATSMDKAVCDLAVGGGNVYWTTGINDQVKSVPVGGGAEAIPVAAPQADTEYENLAVDASRLYWTERSGTSYPILNAPVGGGAPAKLAMTPELVTGFVLVGGQLVGTDPGPPIDPNACMTKGICNYPSGRVVAVPLAGGPITAIYTNVKNLPPAPAGLRGIATDGTDLFWLQAAAVDANVHRNGDGQVVRASPAGGNQAALGTGFNEPQGIAVDDKNVYFTADGHVWKLAKAGGAPVIVADGAGAIAVDDASLYWFDGATVTRACK